MTSTWPLRREPSSEDNDSNEEQDVDLNAWRKIRNKADHDLNDLDDFTALSPKPRISVHSKWYYDRYGLVDDIKKDNAANRDIDGKFKDTLVDPCNALAIYHLSVLNDIRALTALMIGDAGVIDSQVCLFNLAQFCSQIMLTTHCTITDI